MTIAPSNLVLRIPLDVNLAEIIEDMRERERLALLALIMGHGGPGFTAKAREIVNNPGYDE